MKKKPLSYLFNPVICFQVLNYSHFVMKNVGLGKEVIRSETILIFITAGTIVGLNCEVPLYIPLLRCRKGVSKGLK